MKEFKEYINEMIFLLGNKKKQIPSLTIGSLNLILKI